MRIAPLVGLACLLVAPPCFAESPPSTDSGVATQKSKGDAPTGTTKTKTKTSTKTKTTTTKRPTKRPTKRTSTKRTKKRDTKPVVEKVLAKGAIGLHIGGSLSWLTCDCVGANANDEYDSTYGLAAGVYYDKAINRFLSYRGGLRYHSKGASFDLGLDDTVQTAELTLTTVELEGALLVRYGLNAVTTIYLSGGAFAAAILSVDTTLDGEKYTGLDENFAFLDYGLNIGAGAFFALSRSRSLMASAMLNYSHGLANIGNPEKAPWTNADNELLTRALMLTVGVHF